MDGFDDEFADIVDYIVKITHKIWEETGVGFIYDYYAPNCSVHTASGLSYGREEVVAGTLRLLSAFPDRQLHADDVIWTGNDKDGRTPRAGSGKSRHPEMALSNCRSYSKIIVVPLGPAGAERWLPAGTLQQRPLKWLGG